MKTDKHRSCNCTWRSDGQNVEQGSHPQRHLHASGAIWGPVRLIALAVCVVILAAGCALAETPTPTPARPSPTATAMPTLPPTPTPPPPTATPKPVPSPSPTAVPQAAALPPVQFAQYQPGTLLHPLSAAVVSNTVYVIDQGKLKSIDLLAPSAVRVVSPPAGSVQGYPIQELADVVYAPRANALFLLDRSGSIYGYDMVARWWLEREPGALSDYTQEYLVDLADDGRDVYALDTNNGRIFRRATGQWLPLITSPQLAGGIRLAGLGDLYVLVGERPQRPAQVLRLRGNTLTAVAVANGLGQPSHIEPLRGRLLVVDQGFRRWRQLDVDTGNTFNILAMSRNDVDLLAVAANAQSTVLLGADWLIVVHGDLPAYLGAPPATATPLVGKPQPHDLALLASLARLQMPIAGARLPDIDRSLPGAPRPYRFGIHEGIDLYSSTTGVPVEKGTAVRAAAAGTVVRIDANYQEPPPAQMDQWLKQTLTLRMTPADIQDRLGGRQVWLDHGNGLGTRYLHLSGVAAGLKVGDQVKAGDVVGYVGNSGTPEAAAGYESDVHLHFEVRVGDGYLGQWLSPIETRRWLMRLLGF